MAEVKVIINGTSYPCRQTMGAMLRFNRETGKEVTDLKPDSITDLVTYLWCCITSACKHDGIDFDMTLMDFADCISGHPLCSQQRRIKKAGAKKKASRH